MHMICGAYVEGWDKKLALKFFENASKFEISIECDLKSIALRHHLGQKSNPVKDLHYMVPRHQYPVHKILLLLNLGYFMLCDEVNVFWAVVFWKVAARIDPGSHLLLV